MVLEYGIRLHPRLVNWPGLGYSTIPQLGPRRVESCRITKKKKPHRQSLGSKTPNHTSVIQDVVDVTNLQLNLVLAEGGGEHAKNRFGDKTNER